MLITENHCPVRFQAINHGQTIAIQDDQQQISYQQLDIQLTHLAEQLSKQVTDSEPSTPIRLVCIANNGIPLLLLQLVCVRLGWLFCPLNPSFTESEIQQRLNILNSPYCWVEDNSRHHLLNSLNIDLSFCKKNIKPLSPLKINPLQPTNIIFTSGSSGFPKAIVHHYRNHYFSALGSQSSISLQISDRNLLSLPLYHISGYATVMRTIIAGATLDLSNKDLSYPLLSSRKITHLSLVSTQLIRLLKDPHFSAQGCTLKHILLGGSAFSMSLLTALAARGFTYHLSYGCTEMASQVATSTNNSQLIVLPYREVKIHNEQIYFRGATRFIGYFQDNKLIKIDPKRWVSSGDCGRLKGDQLIISGRKDRQFISGGENIQPEEIEALCLQVPCVEKAYIVPIKDAQYGQRMAVFIAFSDANLIHFEQYCEQLKQYLKQHLTRFKQPDHYLAWPSSECSHRLKVPKAEFIKVLTTQGLII